MENLEMSENFTASQLKVQLRSIDENIPIKIPE